MTLKFNPQTNQWEDDTNILASNKVGGQSYPLSPMDLLGDKFGALKGVLPDSKNNNPDSSLLSPMALTQPIIPSSKNINPKSIVSSPQMDVESIDEKENSEPVPQVPSQPHQDKKQEETPSILDELLKAQQEKDDNNKSFAMLQAADRIGNAIAGQGNLGYEANRLDYLKPLLASNVENVLQKQKFKGEEQDQTLKGLNIDKAKLQMADEKAKSDPNSDISKMTRASVVDSLNKIGRTDLAKMASNPSLSSKQLEDTFGQYNLNNMIQAFDAQQNRLELAKMRQEDKNTIKQEKTDKIKDDFITQRYDKIIQSKNYQAMSKMNQAKRLIDDALQNPSGIKDVGALYSLIKMFDPESVVREGELKLTDSARSIWNKANSALSRAGNNPRLLDKNTLKYIKQASDQIYKESEQQYKMQVKPVLDQARKRGIKEEDLSMIDPLHDQMKALDNNKQIEYNVDQDALAAELKKRGL